MVLLLLASIFCAASTAQSSCGGRNCGPSGICCNSVNGLCCPTQGGSAKVCCGSNFCCGANQHCCDSVNHKCCGDGEQCCGPTCCPKGTQCYDSLRGQCKHVAASINAAKASARPSTVSPACTCKVDRNGTCGTTQNCNQCCVHAKYRQGYCYFDGGLCLCQCIN